MSEKKLTGTLEGTLDRTSLYMSGEIWVNDQAIHVNLEGEIPKLIDETRPPEGLTVGEFGINTPDSEEGLRAYFTFDEHRGEFVSTFESPLFSGVQAGSFSVEKGVESEDGTRPIKMRFEESLVVKSTKITGQFEAVSSCHRSSHRFSENVEISLRGDDGQAVHQVKWSGEFTLVNRPEGFFRFRSPSGELNARLIYGALKRGGNVGFAWQRIWATGIFLGAQSGSLSVNSTMININESRLKLELK